MSPVRIIGIDPGSRVTGYGCIRSEGNRLRLIDCGVIRANPRAPLPERLQVLHRSLADLLERHRPEVAAIEDVFHARNAKAAFQLGQARGVLLLALAGAGLPIHEFAPTAVKKAVVGYGRADKGQVATMVQRLLHLRQPPTPTDATDALGLAITAAHTLGPLQRIQAALDQQS